MIDYEKLELLHTLIKQLPKYYLVHAIGIEGQDWQLCTYSLSMPVHYDSIDDLIAKLRELTTPEPEPKYKTAWYMLNGGIETTQVLNQDGYIFCDKTDIRAAGRTMYPTREALIQSQIDHWQELKQEHCEHDYSSTKYELKNGALMCVQCCSRCCKSKPDDTKETCTQNEETSTESSDVSMQST